MDAPCSPWASVDEAPCQEGTEGLTAENIAEGIELATYLLWNLTERAWPGVCTDLVRPGPDRLARCGNLDAVRLPAGPLVTEVLEVTIDGDVLPAATYQLLDGGLLVWLDGETFTTSVGTYQAWPRQNRINHTAGGPRTWTVEYLFGADPPAVWARAAAAFGCQLALAQAGSQACQLPAGTRTVTRQGVAIQIDTLQELLAKGRTGVKDVDRLIVARRHGEKHQPTQVWVPGRRPTDHRLTDPPTS